MIVTLTANPSNDRTIALPARLDRGAVQRVPAATVEPAGKGVNVARAIGNGGIESLAVFPAAADDAYLAALVRRGQPHRAVTITDPVRTNLTLSEPDGTTTKINEPGPTLDDAAVDALVAAVVTAGSDADWVVLSGSLPPGAPTDLYAAITARLRGTGASVAVDTSGPPLLALLDGPALPDLVKPNAHELAELVGGDGDAYEADPALGGRAAQDLVARGIGTVLLTLGAAGTVAATADEVLFAAPLPIEPVSTVGAGDSSLAGWLLAASTDADTSTRLRWATAWGAAAVSLPGSTLPVPDQTHPDDVVVTVLVDPPGG